MFELVFTFSVIRMQVICTSKSTSVLLWNVRCLQDGTVNVVWRKSSLEIINGKMNENIHLFVSTKYEERYQPSCLFPKFEPLKMYICDHNVKITSYSAIIQVTTIFTVHDNYYLISLPLKMKDIEEETASNTYNKRSKLSMHPLYCLNNICIASRNDPTWMIWSNKLSFYNCSKASNE